MGIARTVFDEHQRSTVVCAFDSRRYAIRSTAIPIRRRLCVWTGDARIAARNIGIMCGGKPTANSDGTVQPQFEPVERRRLHRVPRVPTIGLLGRRLVSY